MPRTSSADVAQFLERTRSAVRGQLERWSAEITRDADDAVAAAIAYSLQANGKRFRPALLLAAYGELGGAGDASELATAVEIVHTYSLVHDDLPCMDDDDLRRGRPTTHCQFDVPTATVAGYQMVMLSARVLAAGAARLELEVERVSAIAVELYRAAGAAGMVGGQVLDLEAEGREIALAELEQIHHAKTGALITASAVIGAMAAGTEDGTLATIRDYGTHVGLAFQIIDDVLDATGTSHELGKTAGKDAAHQKPTFATLLGVDRAQRVAVEHTERAVDLLREHGLDCKVLEGLARFIVERRK